MIIHTAFLICRIFYILKSYIKQYIYKAVSMGSDKEFYLGRLYNLKKTEITNEDLIYDPPDLTTHAIVTGMTGSGKTGLCVGLLEEAALQGIPAIIIDPKGDLTNLVLAFPDLTSEDFEPWMDASAARREKKSLAEVAEKTASLWKQGLADWGLGSKEIKAYKQAVDRAIYTPGSTTGLPVNILASFNAPDIPWKENEEVLREKISSTVTALLTLIGLKDIDPLRSREHILLANIIEFNWKKSASLDLPSLIQQTQTPPIDQLGAFSLDDFFPKKERAELAMLLNNFLASPSFQSWIEGQPLDIQKMLYSEDGKPRHSIFYLAHLADTERMFFVTLLYSAVETWMRKQRGTGDLRALVYFDEIHGYLPPVANPPSKPLIIRLLKTARAFGVGLVLTTQNPVDVDYKALSNAGTWMVGRLQTDQDKQRLLDGLESAAGGIRRSDFDKLISALGKRVFLYHNVHEKKPAVFHTRWVMSYLAGPLTITQVPKLNELAGAEPFKDGGKKESRPTATARETGKPKSTKPESPEGVREYFMPLPSDNKKAVYKPSLLAVGEVRYLRQRPSVDTSHTLSAVVQDPRESRQNWEESIEEKFDAGNLLGRPQSSNAFSSLPDFMDKPSWWSGQERDFEHWIYETDTVVIRENKTLGITTIPGISEEEFLKECQKAAEEKAEKEINDLEKKFETKKATIENRIERQVLRIDKYKKDLASRGLDTAFKVGESLFKLATKKKLTGLSSSSTKARMTADARTRLKEAKTVLENYKEELLRLEENLEEKKQETREDVLNAAEDISEVKITPTKQNIRITHFGILWKTG